MKKKKFPYESILVVCSVNTARSRMAEGFLKDFCSKNDLDIEIFSGGIGTNARDGMLISMDARLAMKEEGIELSDKSTSINLKSHPELINKADLILTLTEQHKKEIMEFLGCNDKRICTLKEFAGERGDISDPSMKELEGFRIVRDEIKNCLIKGLKRLI